MVNVVLAHSALGLDANIEYWADWLRGEGHVVSAVDFYGGVVYDNLDDGVARADAGDMGEYAQTVRAAAREFGGPVVIVGFSLGAAAGEIAALTEPGVVGVVLVGGALSPEWIGNPPWPAGLRGQLHYAVEDPWMEADQTEALQAAALPGALETFTYPGGAHLFAFPSFADYDPLAAESLRTEVKAFLSSLG